MNHPNLSRFAALMGATPEQVQRQLAKNRTQLTTMADTARKNGKKVNGYTADELTKLTTK